MGFEKKQNVIWARILLQASKYTPELDQDGKKLGFPCFEVKDGDVKEFYQIFNGKFNKIELGSYHSEELNEDKELVKIWFDCEDKKVCLSASWTSAMRSIVNSLAGCKTPIDNISMGLYIKSGKDGKTYPAVWIKNNNERMDWLLSLEDQKNYSKEIEFKGKKMKDRSPMEEYLKQQFEKINLNSARKKEDGVKLEEPIQGMEVGEENEKLPF